ncbi:MAG: serine/threonine-protein kinase RsbW [Acidobacteriota bacterium]|jgi:serine/threonine-protein kinase RsbW|nr:serine/threonine-protein kinase RsbW [Acidobacteriota bacterium]
MPPKKQNKNGQGKPILGRIAPDEFVGRGDALDQVVRHASTGAHERGLLLLGAPSTGISELLRQAYDELFREGGVAIPIYFALTRNDKTAVGTAKHFLQTFLLQLIAFRRQDATLASSSLSLRDLLELAAPGDYEWIERLVEMTERARMDEDARSYIRLCLSAPQRAATGGARPFILLDGLELAERLNGVEVPLGTEIAQAMMHSGGPYVLAGLRRHLLDVVYSARNGNDFAASLRLERLNDDDARTMVEHLARRNDVTINDQTRDLIVQQTNGNPFYLTSILRAARESNVALTSFRNCQQLYVDELMGGRINRHFTSILEEVAPSAAVRRSLIRVLYESAQNEQGRAPVETWRKRLNLEPEHFQKIIRQLHVHELASLNSNFVEAGNDSLVWLDYLRARYRLEVAAEPRALVVADTLSETLKRAPQTMARHYRRVAALGLRELLERFNCQRVPASLFHYDRFSRTHKGMDADDLVAALDAETDLVRLPQVVHAASCAAFHPPMQQVCDVERSAVAHGFDAGQYSDANEVVWLAAEIESKLEAGRGVTEIWCDRLMQVARVCGFSRVRLWLVAPEGFNADASELLNEREAYGSSRKQLELLTERINAASAAMARQEVAPDEFEMVIPMGDDTELIAAHTVEQIARRISFQPEAINQIKTALVEACINATEHSLSPDRKIYQRFRVESDRLVVTVSSRGVVPPGLSGQNGVNGNGSEATAENSKERRGWGLKLIRSLMDEVEFERVDDGTRLRMTKYLHKP